MNHSGFLRKSQLFQHDQAQYFGDYSNLPMKRHGVKMLAIKKLTLAAIMLTITKDNVAVT